MAWIKLDETLREHHKVDDLAEALDIEPHAAVGIVCCLWMWALTNAGDGDLQDFKLKKIAKAALWNESKAGELIDALIKAGFLDDDFRIHNWEKYAGKLMESREKNKEKSAKHRERVREKKKEIESLPIYTNTVPGYVSGYVTDTSPLRDRLPSPKSTPQTREEKTREEKTRVDKTREEKTSQEETREGDTKGKCVPPTKKPPKTTYGEFENVKLTDDEHCKLIATFGMDEAKERIDRLSGYIASKGDKYKSHYATILQWARKDATQPQQTQKPRYNQPDYTQTDSRVLWLQKEIEAAEAIENDKT